MSPNRPPRILLCISGGIAAYKTPHIVRGFVQSAWEVIVVLTESARAFVSPMVLATLSKNRVWGDGDYLNHETGSIPHIHLAEWADAVVVAPCTAESAARLAAGHGKHLMDGILLATRAPVVVFPAMNVNMLHHGATVRNLALLRDMGYRVIDPDDGDLACGYQGAGRLPEVDGVVHEVRRVLTHQDMAGMTVTVTAGPTREYLDPVRFISNPSTGKMGYALAQDAWYRGASVTLISGPVSLPSPRGVRVVQVATALEMRDACVRSMAASNVMVKAAAVGDYRFPSRSERKIKREGRSEMTLAMVQNPDIAAELGAMKARDQILVGFAAETDDLQANAEKKLRSKNLDLIVANDLTKPGSGFGCDTNRVSLYDRFGRTTEVEGPKNLVARGIWDRVLALRNDD